MIGFSEGIFETERLFLRELIPEDRDDLGEILCDPESMKYYPAPFDAEKIDRWIEWSRENYRLYGHGLWAVILKEGNVFLGDCGITIQEIEDKRLPEIGYHIKKEYWGRGYATEAAKACKQYAFENFSYDTLYTYTKHDNLPSIRVAEKNGMSFVRYFQKNLGGTAVREVLYCLSRGEYEHNL